MSSDINNLKSGKGVSSLHNSASFEKKIDANLNPNYTFEDGENDHPVDPQTQQTHCKWILGRIPFITQILL